MAAIYNPAQMNGLGGAQNAFNAKRLIPQAPQAPRQGYNPTQLGGVGNYGGSRVPGMAPGVGAPALNYNAGMMGGIGQYGAGVPGMVNGQPSAPTSAVSDGVASGGGSAGVYSGPTTGDWAGRWSGGDNTNGGRTIYSTGSTFDSTGHLTSGKSQTAGYSPDEWTAGKMRWNADGTTSSLGPNLVWGPNGEIVSTALKPDLQGVKNAAATNYEKQLADKKASADAWAANPASTIGARLQDVGTRDVGQGVRNASGEVVQWDKKTGEERTYNPDTGAIGEWKPIGTGLPAGFSKDQMIADRNSGVKGYNDTAFGMNFQQLVDDFTKKNKKAGKNNQVDPVKSAMELLAIRNKYQGGPGFGGDGGQPGFQGNR